MSINLTTKYYQNILNQQARYGNIIARFVAMGTGTGDGSGGIVTGTIYLGESVQDTNYWFIATQYWWSVVNTGVAYVGSMYINEATMTMTPEETNYSALPCVVKNLIDWTSGTCLMVNEPIILGRAYSDIPPELKMVINTNTNTKNYGVGVQGYITKGYPIIAKSQLGL